VKSDSPRPIPLTCVREDPPEGGSGMGGARASPVPEGTPDTATRSGSPLGEATSKEMGLYAPGNGESPAGTAVAGFRMETRGFPPEISPR
jgi:hypothetical protein